jgi:hypothetical protein
LKQHKLLLYEIMSRRRRTLLLLLAVAVFGAGIYDQFSPIFGDDLWYIIWVAWPFFLALWFYYAVLLRRAAIQVRPDYLRLQGPVSGVNISYGRIYAATSAQMEQHFRFKELKGGQRSWLKPLYQQTCLFIELSSYPPAFKHRNLWFSPFLFGSSRPGIICAVDDWMALSQDVETARGHRQEKYNSRRQEDTRSLAMKLLDEDIQFE